MLEHKHKGILSLNLKKLANRVDDLKIILVLQNEMLLVMLFCKHFLKQREDIPRYGKTINNSFLGTVCSTYYGETCHHFKVKAGEYSGISPLMNKQSK